MEKSQHNIDMWEQKIRTFLNDEWEKQRNHTVSKKSSTQERNYGSTIEAFTRDLALIKRILNDWFGRNNRLTEKFLAGKSPEEQKRVFELLGKFLTTNQLNAERIHFDTLFNERLVKGKIKKLNGDIKANNTFILENGTIKRIDPVDNRDGSYSNIDILSDVAMFLINLEVDKQMEMDARVGSSAFDITERHLTPLQLLIERIAISCVKELEV